MKKILVLCTGNSCRSQMAEDHLRYFAGENLEICSAGVEPLGVNIHRRVCKQIKNYCVNFKNENDA